MSREQLLGLADDVDRLLVAGVAAAGGDSLRRRGATLRELGKKVPALVPVADAVERVVAANKPGPAFLDLLVMGRQLRGSLAAAGVEGPLAPLPAGASWRTPLPVRELRPVYEALTVPGAGREGCLQDAVARNLFADLRLTAALFEALEDGYAPVADAAAEQGLPALGIGVLDELLSNLKLDGKALDARRLRAVCRIEPKVGAGLCRKALAEGSAALRVEALNRLPEVGGADEAEKEGLKYCGDKSRDVRAAALRSLAAGKGEEALATLLAALDDKEFAVRLAATRSLAESRHPRAAARLLAELQGLLPLLEEGPKKKAKKGSSGKRTGLPPKADATTLRAQSLVDALGKRKDGDRAAAARTMLALFPGGDPQLLFWVVAALGEMGPVIPEIAPALVDALAVKDNLLPFKALAVLEEFPPAERLAAVPALARFVEGGAGDNDDRVRALAFLCEHGDGRREVLAAARAALADRGLTKDYGIWDVLEALGKLGPRGKPLLPEIWSAFRDAPERRTYGMSEAGKAVARIDPEGAEAIPELIGMLGQKKKLVWALALHSLAAYRSKAREAIPAVELLTKSKDSYTKDLAEQTLQALKGLE
jgi:hypothetical protein